METYNDSLELQEMREQLNLLNRKLEKEHILNEKILRKSMHKDIARMHRWEKWNGLLTPIVMAPFMILLYTFLHLSLTFVLVTYVLFCLVALFTWYKWKNLDQNELLSGNLIEASRKLVHMHQFNSRWTLYSIPFLIVWFCWFYMEVQTTLGDASVLNGTIVGGLVGGLIGGSCGLYAHLKIQRTLKETIKDIENLTSSDETRS